MTHTKSKKWIEWLRVRSSAAALEGAMPTLESQVEEIAASAEGVETYVLRHGLYDGDLAVVVVWWTETEPRTTLEGSLVAQSLQQLGSVEHAVWVPANRQQSAVTLAQSDLT